MEHEKRVAVNWKNRTQKFPYEDMADVDVIGFGKPGNYQIFAIPEKWLKRARLQGATLNKHYTEIQVVTDIV